MSYSISTLLLRNLSDVFGENDPARRRAALAALGLNWKYYAQTPGIIWDAPEANPQTCYTQTGPPPGNPACSGTEWGHVVFSGALSNTNAPILSDIQNCQLPAISWVT